MVCVEWVLPIGLETCSYRPGGTRTPLPSYRVATTAKQKGESKTPQLKHPRDQKCMWKGDSISDCEGLQEHISSCTNTKPEPKPVAKRELVHPDCNVPWYRKGLASQVNEKPEAAFDLWHRLAPGDGQRGLNDGAAGRKWLLCAAPY